MEIKDLPEAYQKQAIAKYGKDIMKKKPKYGNTKLEVDGHVFDSLKEASYYGTLKYMEKAGEISHLVIQPRYELIPAFTKNGKKYRKTEYVADFQYDKDGEIIVVDTKGCRTDVYKLKRKMFEYRYPDLTIEEV